MSRIVAPAELKTLRREITRRSDEALLDIFLRRRQMMPLTVGVLKELLEGETRVALTPEITGKLQKLGVAVVAGRYLWRP